MIPAILAALGEAGGAAGASGAASGGMGQVASKVQSGIGGLKDSIQGLANPTSKADAAVHKLYTGFNLLPSKILEVQHLITSTANHWVSALAAPANTIKQLGDSISGFVRLASPATVKQFEYRIENTFATIGNIVLPVMEALTRAAERVGNGYAKLKPAFEPAIRGISDLIDTISGNLDPALKMLAPSIKLISIQFLGLVKAFEAGLLPMKAWMALIEKLPGAMGPWGILGGFDKKGQSDVAVRSARMIGTEDLHRDMSKNALEASVGGEKKKTTENWLEQIYNFLSQNLTKDALMGYLRELAGPAAKFIEKAPTDTSLPSIVNGLWRAINTGG